jgi:hypothetical protein
MIRGVATLRRIGCGKSIFLSRKTVLKYTVIIETKFSDIAKDSYIHQASQNISSLLEWYFLKL